MRETCGPYRIVRPLGEGGQGCVYLAHEPGSDAAVALKLVALPPQDAAARGRLLAEAFHARRLSHPNIAGVIAAGEESGTGWIAMHYAPGVSLRRYVHRSRLLPEPLVVLAALRVAQALEHAHAMGIVHRDVKPSNIIVHWPLRRVTLTDFGVARGMLDESTGTGIVVGTPAYLAPELLAGAIPEARTDLYALGVTIYELTTGELPFAAPSMGELLRQVSQSPAPELRTLSTQTTPALSELVASLLAKRSADRPRSAGETAARLQALLGGGA